MHVLVLVGHSFLFFLENLKWEPKYKKKSSILCMYMYFRKTILCHQPTDIRR